MEPPRELVLTISSASDPSAARQAARRMALAIGFDETASEEISLVTSELATNLVKYAGSGIMTLSPLNAGSRAGIQIESRDRGPGIVDIDQALADGFSTSGSLGVGLGTANRLMDEFDIVSHRGSGTVVTCKRWIRVAPITAVSSPLAFGVASRPHPRMQVNGDSFVLKEWNSTSLVGVIDGLGHGPAAHRAAEAARHYVETHYDRPLASIFRGVGYACRGTRGVVMALARFDWAPLRLTFATVGNIEVRALNTPEPFHYMIRRGIIGANAPAPVVTTHAWSESSILVLYSDGLRTHWRVEDFPGLFDRPPAMAAQILLDKLARDEDDATVLVVKQAQRVR